MAKREARHIAASKMREAANTFEYVAREWLERHCKDITAGHKRTIELRLTRYLLPHLGNIPITELTPPTIMKAVSLAEKQGHIETAKRALGIVSQVCRYARLMQYTQYNAADGLTSLLPKKQEQHHATITNPQEIGHLLRAIDVYPAQAPAMYYALQIMPYVFVRSGELRAAEWAEVDLNTATWTIPANRMKMRRPHVVPLA